MTRHFSLRKMLRMTPNHLLREFFQRFDQQPLAFDWRQAPERCDEGLMICIHLMPKGVQEEIEASLAEVHELACDGGVQMILEIAKLQSDRDFVARLPSGGPYRKAMWVWLNHQEIFEQALLRHSVDNLTRWRKRKDLPTVEPRRCEEANQELAAAISSLLRCEEGRGQHCTVEHYQRTSGTDYYVAYPDDFVQTVAAHDERGTLRPRSVRKTFEIVFAFNEQDGTLELYAKTTSRIKEKLECLFGQVILGEDIGPHPYSRPYDLNRLKDRYFCLQTDPADGITASITRLRLKSRQWGKIGLEPVRNGHLHDVYEMVDHCLNHSEVNWDESDIQMASFQFQFDPLYGRRGGVVKFDVTYPDYCTVRSRRPERIDLVRKYLRRWRIADV
jgi:hypothetical protein